ncbi:hypothetical protein Tco_1025025, partial [Tanacetum coccineum]
MHEDIKVPLILGRPFLSTAHAKIDVFKRTITLRVGEEKIISKSVKPAYSLIKRVYMLSLRERMELDLEAKLMGETLMLNRSLDPLYGDYIKLNDLNVPLELRRDQVDDLMPTIKEGKVLGIKGFYKFLLLIQLSTTKRRLSTAKLRIDMHDYLTRFEVIVNGDAPAAIASASAGSEGPIPPKTTEQKLARKNELKAKSTLLLAIPDKHLLKFHGIKDAKSLCEAIKNRFRGNKESKKMQKTILKQQYENFAASRSEGLDKTYDRFQKLISQLEIHGEVISQ